MVLLTFVYAAGLMCVQMCPILCNSMDCSRTSSSVHGIFQARILEWVAISYSRGSSWPRDQTRVSDISCIGRQILYISATWEAPCMCILCFCNHVHPSFSTSIIILHTSCTLLFPLNPDSAAAAVAAKLLQSRPTLCDPIDGSPPGPAVPGILQARTLEWFAISSSNAWKWKVKVKSLSRVRLLVTPWTAAYQAPPSMGFSRQE